MRLSHFHNRIVEKTQDVSAAALLIVAFGDSVTQGFTKANTIEPDIVYHKQLKEKLEKAYPLCTFSVINAGVAGFTALDSLERLERDVIRFLPDLVLIAFGLNDAVVLGEKGIKSFKNTLEKMLDEIHTKTPADIILLSPNFMGTADNQNIHPDEQQFLADLLAVQTQGILASYANAIREVAMSRNLALADIYKIWTELVKQGKNTNSFLANGLNHPNAEAHEWVAEAIFEAIERA